jgi:hypothetical protein
MGVNPGFRHLGGGCLILGMVNIAEKKLKNNRPTFLLYELYPHPNPIILSPIRGGDDYRSTYDTGLKRGFYGVYRPFIECPLIG